MFDYILYIGGAIFIVYGAMPILVWSQNRLPDKYTLVSVPIDEFLLESDSSFRALASEVGENGFRCIAASFFNNQTTHSRFLVFVHEEKNFSAIVTQITNPNVPAVLYLEISQIFNDNTLVGVMNAPTSGAYPKSSRKVTFRFSDVTEVEYLVRIMEHILTNYLSSKIAIALPEGRELKKIEEFLNDELAVLIRQGYVQNSVQSNLRSYTLKGAYLMTWKLLWPVKQICNYRDLAFSKKILSEVQVSN